MRPAELLLQCCLHIRRERLTHWCRWIHSSFVLDGLRVLAFSFDDADVLSLTRRCNRGAIARLLEIRLALHDWMRNLLKRRLALRCSLGLSLKRLALQCFWDGGRNLSRLALQCSWGELWNRSRLPQRFRVG